MKNEEPLLLDLGKRIFLSDIRDDSGLVEAITEKTESEKLYWLFITGTEVSLNEMNVLDLLKTSYGGIGFKALSPKSTHLEALLRKRYSVVFKRSGTAFVRYNVEAIFNSK